MMQGVLESSVGRSIKSANSSLRSFSIEFSDGQGLLIEAGGTPDSPAILVTAPPAEELPQAKDAVCAVDWSWIYQSKVDNVGMAPTAVRFTLNPAGPLTVAVAVWQGSPFLSFQPFGPTK